MSLPLARYGITVIPVMILTSSSAMISSGFSIANLRTFACLLSSAKGNTIYFRIISSLTIRSATSSILILRRLTYSISSCLQSSSLISSCVTYPNDTSASPILIFLVFCSASARSSCSLVILPFCTNTSPSLRLFRVYAMIKPLLV